MYTKVTNSEQKSVVTRTLAPDFQLLVDRGRIGMNADNSEIAPSQRRLRDNWSSTDSNSTGIALFFKSKSILFHNASITDVMT